MAEKMTLEEALAKAQTYTVMHGKSGQYPDGSGWGHAWNEEGMWLPRKAWDVIRDHITQPAQAVDVDRAAEDLYDWLIGLMPNGDLLNAAVACDFAGAIRFKKALADKLRALGNAQAEGWKPTDDDVLAWQRRNGITLSLYDCRTAIEDARMAHHFDVSPTPPQPEE